MLFVKYLLSTLHCLITLPEFGGQTREIEILHAQVVYTLVDEISLFWDLWNSHFVVTSSYKLFFYLLKSVFITLNVS